MSNPEVEALGGVAFGAVLTRSPADEAEGLSRQPHTPAGRFSHNIVVTMKTRNAWATCPIF